MDTEIELKFLVLNGLSAEQTENKITEVLTAKKYPFTRDKKALINHYFDTHDLNLRKNDMGLRVRSSNSIDLTTNEALKTRHIEQTIKTAGQVIGGLHQRPEYNVDINDDKPTLALFPVELWHEQQNVEKIQANLVNLFTTNFIRSIWQVTLPNASMEDTIIELVFDQGSVCANEQREEICEIELELVKGNVDDLFTLAKALCFALPLRPGMKSKAARGYALRHPKKEQTPEEKNTGSKLPTLALVPLASLANLNDVFITGIEFGLHQLQTTVANYIDDHRLLFLPKVTESLALLRQGFWLFNDMLTPELKKLRNELSFFIKKLYWVEDASHLQEIINKTGNYRAKLEYNETLLTQLKREKNNYPDDQALIELFHSPRFNRLQLALLSLILHKNMLQPSENKTITSFAQEALDTSLQRLVDVMPASIKLTRAMYIAEHKIIIRSLLTGSWFGDLYEKNDRLAFRNPWLDLKQGISELETMLLLQRQLALLSEPSVKMNAWLDNKIEHLMLTLEQSRQTALSIYPYWRS